MPPTTIGTVAAQPAARKSFEHVDDEHAVGSGQDRQADHMDALVAGRAPRSLRGREADALVDDLHADVACLDRDLFGAVAVAVEPGLADEDLERPAQLGARVCVDAPAHASRSPPMPHFARPGRHAGRRPVLTEDLLRRVSDHSPVVTPAWRHGSTAA